MNTAPIEVIPSDEVDCQSIVARIDRLEALYNNARNGDTDGGVFNQLKDDVEAEISQLLDKTKAAELRNLLTSKMEDLFEMAKIDLQSRITGIIEQSWQEGSNPVTIDDLSNFVDFLKVAGMHQVLENQQKFIDEKVADGAMSNSERKPVIFWAKVLALVKGLFIGRKQVEDSRLERDPS